jgi:hypothetical protein
MTIMIGTDAAAGVQRRETACFIELGTYFLERVSVWGNHPVRERNPTP